MTSERDVTTDFVVLELQKRGLAYLRLNTETISRAKVSYRPSAADWVIGLEDRRYILSGFRSAYFRRPGLPLSGQASSDPVTLYRQQEWNSLLRSLYTALNGRWLSDPRAIDAAEDKPRQQAVAMGLGFDVPETLVTNDFDEAALFVGSGPTVAKPLRSGLIEDGETGRVIFTTRLESIAASARASFEAAPIILQREIPKRRDVRVTVVGNRVFAANIDSQARAETRTDWRRGSFPDLPHEKTELAQATADRCVRLVSELNLRFGAIDLVEDIDGRHWFLEINPNGQWAWIERRTGYPIASAIVDELCA